MSEPRDRRTSYFSPEPHYRPTWAQRVDEPAGPFASGESPAPGTGPRGSRPASPLPWGPFLAVAILSAILGSGGTYMLLASSGQIERPAATLVRGTTPTPTTPTVPPGDSSDIIIAAATVSPAVVTITSVADFDPTTGTLPTVGVGSGVIYDPAGWILTNCHVVKGGSTLQVALKDGTSYEGRVYGIDTLTDLAIVKVEASGLPAVPIGDSSALEPGQRVIAVGSPLGTYTNSVTSGIVSALGRSIVAQGPEGCNDVLHNLIQTDAAINFGNSGGALAAGSSVIGINTAVATQAQGIGFAIPINIAKPIMAQALEGKELARPYMGIRYVTLDSQEARQRNLTIEFGALIAASSDQTEPGVVPGSPAAAAGLREGDIITDVDGERIDASHDLNELLAEHDPGDEITLKVLRNGATIEVSVTLGTRPAGL